MWLQNEECDLLSSSNLVLPAQWDIVFPCNHQQILIVVLSLCMIVYFYINAIC